MSWRCAWPSAVWGNIPVEGGVQAAHRSEIAAAADRTGCMKALEETYRTVALALSNGRGLRHRRYHSTPAEPAGFSANGSTGHTTWSRATWGPKRAACGVDRSRTGPRGCQVFAHRQGSGNGFIDEFEIVEGTGLVYAGDKRQKKIECFDCPVQAMQ